MLYKRIMSSIMHSKPQNLAKNALFNFVSVAETETGQRRSSIVTSKIKVANPDHQVPQVSFSFHPFLSSCLVLLLRDSYLLPHPTPLWSFDQTTGWWLHCLLGQPKSPLREWHNRRLQSPPYIICHSVLEVGDD
jgi:hypothetical protein